MASAPSTGINGTPATESLATRNCPRQSPMLARTALSAKHKHMLSERIPVQEPPAKVSLRITTERNNAVQRKQATSPKATTQWMNRRREQEADNLIWNGNGSDCASVSEVVAQHIQERTCRTLRREPSSSACDHRPARQQRATSAMYDT